MRNERIHLIALLLVLIIFAGCIDPLALIKSAQNELSVTITSDGCTEDQWVVPSEETITVAIDNQAGEQRQWMVMGRPATPPFDADDEKRVFVILEAPLGKSEQVFKAPAMAGQYQVFCGIAGQVDAAVRSRLVVVRP
jgi:hypothetical protein